MLDERTQAATKALWAAEAALIEYLATVPVTDEQDPIAAKIIEARKCLKDTMGQLHMMAYEEGWTLADFMQMPDDEWCERNNHV